MANTIQKVKAWIDYRIPVFSFMKHALEEYPTPKNLNYMWNFGSLAGIILVLMMATGIFLAMHYDPSAAHAFESVEHIMRDVNYGWLLRYMHMNGASFFFIVIYIHIFRNLYYGSYKSPRELLWIVGVLILLMMMATAFMGYVLPWGQMSYWGATVITNLFSAFPGVGESIVTWLWGGFAVGSPTLNRFFVLHYLLPFLLVGAVAIHLIALHQHKSNNPLGIEPKKPSDMIPFHPYYTVKDMFGFSVFALVFGSVIFFAPNLFSEPDNYIPANPLVTPPHIVPEWYFLPFYAILRAVESKLGGVLAMFGAVVVLFFVPWLDRSPVKSARFRPLYRIFFWLFVINAFVLGWVGAHPPEGNFIIYGRLATTFYFVFFLVIMPVLGVIEKPRPLPENFDDMPSKSTSTTVVGVLIMFLFLTGVGAVHANEGLIPPKQEWSFSGPLGTYDRAQLQRGFQVYKEVCSACHSVSHLSYRNLSALGFSQAEVKAIAAQSNVQDGPNDQGEMFERPARPSDRFVAPFPNEEAARASNNGAYPVDLSLVVKARPGGADYVYALLTGFTDAPEGAKIPDGQYYNTYFPGHFLSMAPPLTDGQVTFSDGTEASVAQMSRDATAFLAWASEPHMEERKRMGVKTLIFLSVLTVCLYFAMRRIWRRVK